MFVSKPAKLKVAFVCKPELAPFAEAMGIDVVVKVKDREEACRALEELRRRGDVGVILVQASVYPWEEVSRMESLYPVVTPFPGPKEEKLTHPETLYRPLIRKYIGVEVRLPSGGSHG